MKHYRIYDVARKCGCSPAAVSRVFNHRGYVAAELRAKIIRVAGELRYRPSFTARQRTIVIVSDGAASGTPGGYRNTLIGELIKRASERRYAVSVIPASDAMAIETGFVDGVCAVIYKQGSAAVLGSLRVPVVAVNCPITGASLAATDHRQGMALACDHLRRSGHRSIGLITSGDDSWGMTERTEGFHQALPTATKADIVTAKGRSMPEAISVLIRRGVSAVIVGWEDGALPVSHALYVLGKRVPEDISIISLENPSVSEFLTPPHTTIAQGFDSLAGAAFTLLESAMRGEKPAAVMLKNSLIERDSVRAFRKRRK